MRGSNIIRALAFLTFVFLSIDVGIGQVGGGGALLSGPFIPAQRYGFSSTNTAAGNSAAIAAALASGNAIGILPESNPFQTAGTIVISGGQTLIGGNVAGVVIQPPTNTIGVQAYGANNHIGNFTIAYASPEPSANTGAIGFAMGNASVSQYLYYSDIHDIFVQNSNAAFASASSSYGEFQNHFRGLRALTFSKYGIYEPSTNSGSIFDDTRIQNESSTPTGADCTTGISFTNAFNVVFNTLNVEFMDCSSAVMAFNQSTVTINGLHFEQIVQPNFTQMISVNFQNFLSINNFSIQNSTINDASGQLFNIYASGSTGGSNTVVIDGFTELGNTFTAKLPLWASDGNYNHVYVKGVNGRNSGNVVVSTRNDLVQYEGYLTDTPGGRLVAGCVGTAAPTNRDAASVRQWSRDSAFLDSRGQVQQHHADFDHNAGLAQHDRR